MTQEDFQVVAELYQLLAKFPPNAIRAASRKGSVSLNIRKALIALYKEARSKDEASDDDGGRALASRKNSPRPGPISPAFDEFGSAYKELLANLMDQQKFPTKQALLDLERKLGFRCSIRPRDSKERAARKIIRAATASEDKARRLLEIAQIPSKNQTEGWLSLIVDRK